MGRNKQALNDSQLIHMMGVIEEHLRNTKQTEIIQELQTKFNKVSRPFGNKMLTPEEQAKAYELQEGFIRAYFPNLQKTIYPDQAQPPEKNTTLAKTQIRKKQLPKQGEEVTNALNEAIQKVTVAIIKSVPEKIIKASSPETIIAAEKPVAKTSSKAAKTTKPVEAKPTAVAVPKQTTSSQNITLKEEISALNTAYKSEKIKEYPETKAHLRYILRQIPRMQSEPVKKQIIAEKFEKLDAYIAGNNTNITTAYIIHQTYQLLLPDAKIQKAVNVLEKYQAHIKAEIKANIKALSSQDKGTICSKILQKNLADLTTKEKTLEKLIPAIKSSKSDAEAKQKLNSSKEDLSFSRNPVLRLFGLKTSALGTTGSEHVAEADKALSPLPKSWSFSLSVK